MHCCAIMQRISIMLCRSFFLHLQFRQSFRTTKTIQHNSKKSNHVVSLSILMLIQLSEFALYFIRTQYIPCLNDLFPCFIFQLCVFPIQKEEKSYHFRFKNNRMYFLPMQDLSIAAFERFLTVGCKQAVSVSLPTRYNL